MLVCAVVNAVPNHIVYQPSVGVQILYITIFLFSLCRPLTFAANRLSSARTNHHHSKLEFNLNVIIISFHLIRLILYKFSRVDSTWIWFESRKIMHRNDQLIAVWLSSLALISQIFFFNLE